MKDFVFWRGCLIQGKAISTSKGIYNSCQNTLEQSKNWMFLIPNHHKNYYSAPPPPPHLVLTKFEGNTSGSFVNTLCNTGNTSGSFVSTLCNIANASGSFVNTLCNIEMGEWGELKSHISIFLSKVDLFQNFWPRLSEFWLRRSF